MRLISFVIFGDISAWYIKGLVQIWRNDKENPIHHYFPTTNMFYYDHHRIDWEMIVALQRLFPA